MAPLEIAVIGAGMMGRGIAACVISGGHNVTLFDTDAQSGPAAVEAANKLCSFLHDNDLPAGHGQRGEARFAKTIPEAVANASIIFEAIVEDTAIKAQVFAEIEKHCSPSAILCSNTSSLSVTEITQNLRTKERCIAAHFIGPAHLVPLVELCPTKFSDPSCVPTVRSFLEQIGKRPITMKKEIDGFIAARLQAAITREAMNIVLSGAADQEAVDCAVYDGFGRRYNQIGPFLQQDFAGIDLTLKTHGRFFPQLGAQQTDLNAEALVAKNRLGVKNGAGNYDWPKEKLEEVSGRRDAELLRRLKADKPIKSKL